MGRSSQAVRIQGNGEGQGIFYKNEKVDTKSVRKVFVAFWDLGINMSKWCMDFSFYLCLTQLGVPNGKENTDLLSKNSKLLPYTLNRKKKKFLRLCLE